MYQNELSDISFQEQASLALESILTIENADGTQKSYNQIRTETRQFFANDWVRADEALMNNLAMQFARACMDGHEHGKQLAQDDQLSLLFNSSVDKHDDHHDHEDRDDDDDDEYEVDPKTGKKTKRKSSKSKTIRHQLYIKEQNY